MSNKARIGSRAPSTTVEFIGPNEARILLDNAAPNRNINEELVLKYAYAMLEGDWHNIGVPLILDERGRLSDGQHRLTAVIESETVQQFNVVEGVEHGKTLLAADTGRKRTVGDILQIITNDPDDPRTFRHVKHLPAIARRVVAYEATGDMNIDVSAVKRLTTANLVEFIADNTNGLEEAASVGKRLNIAVSVSATGAGAAHYVCAAVDHEVAMEFANQVIAPSQVLNPAYTLQQQALKDARGRSSSWVKIPRITAGMYIKAFNMYRFGIVPKQIRFAVVGPKAEPFPTVER